MVKAMHKRFIKRTLELIGAVSVVYIMLEILESHTMDNSEQMARVRLAQPDGGVNEIIVRADQLEKLQEQVLQVQREQEFQKQQQQKQQQQLQQQPQQPQLQQQQQQLEARIEPQHPAQAEEKKDNAPKKAPAQPQKPNNPNPQRNKLPPRPKKPPQRNRREDPINMGPEADKRFSNGNSPDLGVNTNFDKLDIPIPSLKSDGFVLPMLYFDMGPNNLFRLFRQGAVTAYEMGRTVVIPVFHRHPRMGDKASNPFVLPIFDTNYTVDLVWPPSDTIDVGMLKKVMSVSAMKDFKKECQGKLDAVVQCGDVDVKRMDGIKHFQRAAGMRVQKEFSIKSYEELVPNDLSSGIVGPNEYKCLGIIYGKKCLPNQDRWLGTFSRIAKNFWRPFPVRKFALKFLNEVMKNEPYMAVHWRYESDWLDMCKPSRPKGARERNKEICRITMGLTYDDDLRTSFVRSIKDKMADFNLKKIYLASPPNNIDLIRLLNDSFPRNFFYMDDVTEFAEKSEGPGFITNNYKGSFIEQEICFRSTLFLGAALSSWTQTVLTDRLARGIKRHDSVLEVVGKGSDFIRFMFDGFVLRSRHDIEGAPGFPKLVFQFPEGNFNFGGMVKGKKV